MRVVRIQDAYMNLRIYLKNAHIMNIRREMEMLFSGSVKTYIRKV